jgi:hypothetical protein
VELFGRGLRLTQRESKGQVRLMPTVPHCWFARTAQVGWSVCAALALVAGWGLWGGGPLRASDDDPPREGEANPQVFRDEPELVPPLRGDLLGHIPDSTGLPVLPDKMPGEKDKARERAYLLQLDEWEAYCDAVVKAAHTSTRIFAGNDRRDVTYAHLFNEPRKYRGQVVHFEGQLHRVRRFDPPLIVAQAGVKNLYEGWMFSKLYGVNPVCMIFTELPPGVSVAEQMQVEVSFDGYFFKKYRYKAADSKPGTAREVPLVIGHGPVVEQQAAATAPAASVWSGSLLIILLVLVLGTFGLAVGLHWWFRRGDSQVRRRVADARLAQAAPAETGTAVTDWPLGSGAIEGTGNGGAAEMPAPLRWPVDHSAS